MPIPIHEWWNERPSEAFWLEVTRRKDIGTNLKAPQFNEKGEEFWGYSLIHYVRAGDYILHYDGNAGAIVASSNAVGRVWSDDVIWAARGTSARTAKIVPHPRPGWYLGLERYQRLAHPITLTEIRARATEVKALYEAMAREYREPLYFPFEIGTGKRPTRPGQGYLFKLPSLVLRLFEGESRLAAPIPNSSESEQPFVDDYRIADEEMTVDAIDPFNVDPALVERGNRGHAQTQNRLAEYLLSLEITPKSPGPDDPNFDIAWRSNNRIYIAEVKSITSSNEEKQLRLGLGQVLRYAFEMRKLAEAIPVLVLEHAPVDPSWLILCRELNVILTWPSHFPECRLF